MDNQESKKDDTNKLKPSIKKNYFLSTLYQILLFMVPLVSAPYISRVIGTSGVGISSYTRSLQSYFLLFAALGTASYGAREISRSRESKHDYSKLFWEIELLTIISSLVCLSAWMVMTYFYKEYQKYFLVLSLGIVAVLFDISWFYVGLEQFKYTVLQNSIFKILSVVLLFVFVKTENDLSIYLLILNATNLLANLSMWIYLPKFLVNIKGEKLSLKHHFKETMIYFIPTIATSIYTVLDKTLIGLLIPQTYTVMETKIVDGEKTTVEVVKKYSELENGYYEQATKVVDIAKVLTFTSLNAVMETRISYLFKKEAYGEIKEKINKSLDIILFLGIASTLGIIGVARNFVPAFFGEGYAKVIPYVMILSPVVLIIGISNCLGSQYYTPGGYRKKSAMYLVIGAITNLILNCILIPFFWGYGAIVATLIAETTITILYLCNCKKMITIKQILKLGWKKLIAGLLMLGVCFLINYFVKQDILATVLEVVCGATIYVLALLLMRDSFVYTAVKKILSKIKYKRGAEDGNQEHE